MYNDDCICEENYFGMIQWSYDAVSGFVDVQPEHTQASYTSDGSFVGGCSLDSCEDTAS